MKQHITSEQVDELTSKGKEGLRKWWHPTEGDWYIESDEPEILCHIECCEDDVNEAEAECLPLLSIGQMIEFLELNKGRRNGWWDFLFMSYDETDSVFPKEYDKELVDQLWEAVREVLERKYSS